MTWRDDHITEKQIQAIINLTGFLDKEDCTIPATKGEAKDLITILIEEMKVKNERIRAGGKNRCYGDFGDYEEEDEFNQEYDPSWDEGKGL